MSTTTRPVRQIAGVPVFGYRADPDTPPVSLVRFADHSESDTPGPHIHDFPALAYDRRAGEVYVVAAGQVVRNADRIDLHEIVGVFFDAGSLGGDGRAPWPLWRAHPLLFPFLHGKPGGLLLLQVPKKQRAVWDNAIDAIDTELTQRQEGYRQAALAHLTVLLVEVARLAADVVGDLRRSNEPLLAEVFGIIENGYGEPLALRDVARAVGLTPGHLTTVVRRRTGRTVQDWIAERRMTEARRLLTDTELPIGDISQRVGISDPGYFTRQFRRTHGSSPRSWRATRRTSAA